MNNEERGVTVIASGRDEGTLVQFLTVGGFVKFFFSNSFSFVSIINLIVMDLGILVPTDCLTKDDVINNVTRLAKKFLLSLFFTLQKREKKITHSAF